MQAPGHLKGVSGSASWKMIWSRQEVTWSKEGHDVSHIIDMRQRDMMICESKPTENQREVEYCRGKNSLEHIVDTTLDLAVFDIKGSEVMVTWQRADERSKEITQTHGDTKITKWDVPNLTRMQTSAISKSDILPTKVWFHFPHHFWQVPQLFL